MSPSTDDATVDALASSQTVRKLQLELSALRRQSNNKEQAFVNRLNDHKATSAEAINSLTQKLRDCEAANKEHVESRAQRLQAETEPEPVKQLTPPRSALRGRNGEVQDARPVVSVPQTIPRESHSNHQENPREEPAPNAPGTAVLVICYNRPDYLRKTLNSLLRALTGDRHIKVIVSQDGHDRAVQAVVDELADTFRTNTAVRAFEHIHHDQSRLRGDDQLGYSKLARHFEWALTTVFSDRSVKRVILVEDDLEVAVDFFDYFNAVAPIVDSDTTVLAASAWNDLGRPEYVRDSKRLYRSDFFPGLGWMLPRRIWEELQPKWPTAYWDDWLREPAQRKDRHIIRPEIARSHTFGAVGVSRSQFYNEYLAPLELNSVATTWTIADVRQLEDPGYTTRFLEDVNSAEEVALSLPAVQKVCGHATKAHTQVEKVVRVNYSSFAAYEQFARTLRVINDVKANVPRTAFHGVVTLHFGICRLHIAPPGTIA